MHVRNLASGMQQSTLQSRRVHQRAYCEVVLCEQLTVSYLTTLRPLLKYDAC